MTKALRCPTSQLLRIMEDCVVVDSDAARTIFQTLSSTERIDPIDTIPHLSGMTAELSDLAQRSEQWVLLSDSRAVAFRQRAENILRTLGRLLDPSLSNDKLKTHQHILLKCGLAPSIMEALEVEKPPDLKDDGSESLPRGRWNCCQSLISTTSRGATSRRRPLISLDAPVSQGREQAEERAHKT